MMMGAGCWVLSAGMGEVETESLSPHGYSYVWSKHLVYFCRALALLCSSTRSALLARSNLYNLQTNDLLQLHSL